MSVFGQYSHYYDLLYKDKDYQTETDFVAGIISRYAPKAQTVLELGCGTGKHAHLLAKKNYSVHGVDRSDEMLKEFSARKTTLEPALQERLSFSVGDVRTCVVDKKFDAVISLFHVASYQQTNIDLQKMFETASQHMAPGGIFLFDFWFGPAVLTERPGVRVKRMESEHVAIMRIAEPVMHAKEAWVDVNYTIFIRDKKSNMTEELKETHRMHYLHPSEIELLANKVGLRVLEMQDWLTGKQPGFDTWNVYAVLGR